jgi:subtilase family serine protease
VGNRAHTNHTISVRDNGYGNAGFDANGALQYSLPGGETPSSIRQVYGLPADLTTGGSRAIALVDAYHYPTALNDLNTFSVKHGLPPMPDCHSAPAPCFLQVYADAKGNQTGQPPAADCGWAQEAALDIEWAHALAPKAIVILVEARSSSFSDLLAGVDLAGNLLQGYGGGQVSMSWGGSEFRGENSYDAHFRAPNVVYFAASGDSGGKTIYPGVSPFAVSAGGTTINRDSRLNFVNETGWSGSGGGPSRYEPRPSYQSAIAGIVRAQRGAPDFSFDADPNSGVAVYDSTVCQGWVGWMVFGGTSVSSPALAGIVNGAGHYSPDTSTELGSIYLGLGSSSFNDITSGKAGSYRAGPGWDFVTGAGSNKGLGGK